MHYQSNAVPLVHAITNARLECLNGRHVSHVENAIQHGPGNRSTRTVAIRLRYPNINDWQDENQAYLLTFSDSCIDLRQTGDQLATDSDFECERLILNFLTGKRCNVERNQYQDFVNQKWRDCLIVRTTKQRARIAYWLPKSGNTEAWRGRTTVGGYHYLTRT